MSNLFHVVFVSISNVVVDLYNSICKNLCRPCCCWCLDKTFGEPIRDCCSLLYNVSGHVTTKLYFCLKGLFCKCKRRWKDSEETISLKGLSGTTSNKSTVIQENEIHMQNDPDPGYLQKRESIEVKALHNHRAVCSVDFFHVNYKGGNVFEVNCAKCHLSQIVSESSLSFWMLQDLHEQEYLRIKSKMVYAKNSSALRNHALKSLSLKKPPEVDENGKVKGGLYHSPVVNIV